MRLEDAYTIQSVYETHAHSQEVGDVEQNYSNSIQKLLRSSSYSFHSNILMKWLGSDPYQEIG